MIKKVAVTLIIISLSILCVGKSIPKNQLVELGEIAYRQKMQALKSQNCLDFQLKSVDFIVENRDTLLAIFNFSNSGFIILSADDATYPVLAYSNESNFSLEDVSPASRYWIDLYKTEIQGIKRQQLTADEKTLEAWNEIRENSTLTTTEVVIAPLVSATWNQDKYYNQYSPIANEAILGYDNRVPNGCVAVAMGMIMYTLGYPSIGTLSHSYYSDYGQESANFGNTQYHYEAMQDVLNNYNHEVAQLIYHCGVAVDMMFGDNGSGSYSQWVPERIQTYFRYDNSSVYVSRNGGNNSTWQNRLKTELDTHFPLYYSGNSPEGGHAFVCDGYNSDNLFHFNFGWGGSGNGYYTTSSSGNDPIHGYSYNQGIVYFHPGSNYPTYCNESQGIYDAVAGTLTDNSGPQNYQNNSHCTYVIAPPNVDYFSVKVVSLSTEAGYDSLTFWNGHPSQGQLIKTFSGQQSNYSFTANTDSLYVTFISDNAITDQGWKFTYSGHQTQPTCSGIIAKTTASGDYSDGSGSDNYAANLSCSLVIQVIGAQWIDFTFSKFNISPEDVLQIVNLQPNSSDPYNNGTIALTGSTIPNKITIPYNRVRVNFFSDNRLQKDGFDLHWSSDLALRVEDATQHSQFTVYPNPAQNMVTVLCPEINGVTTLTINDMTGRRIYSQKIFSSEEKIDISNYPAGLYVINVQNQKGTYTSKLSIIR